MPLETTVFMAAITLFSGFCGGPECAKTTSRHSVAVDIAESPEALRAKSETPVRRS
jgi:hypothetical protein